MSSSAAEARAFALLAADRLAEAEAAWREILSRDPRDARAQHFLGCVLARAGRLAEGLALVDRSVQLEPRNAMFLANRARVLADAGDLERAIADLRLAAQADPGFADAPRQLGLLLDRLGRARFLAGDASGARAAFEGALEARPGDPDILNNLGVALNALGLHGEAADRFRAALAGRPAFAEARLHWGHALRDSGDLESAASMYAQAVEDRPGFLPARLACASAALDRGELGRARALYEEVLAETPDCADARYGLGQVALREHRFAEGWEGYEWRFDTDPPQAARRESSLPRLDASNLARVSKVAVWGEQGLGDQLLFATLLPELEARGIGIALDVDPRLGPILARRLHRASVVAPGRYEGCDAQVGIASLGALFRPDTASFARQPKALLPADADRVARFAAMLPAGRRRVGISWRSFRGGGLALRKSAPLESFGVLAAGGAALVDLQYGDVGAERERFEARHPRALVRLAGLDPMNDLEGMLAAIAACDVVVTTSNVTAHLAGAAGKETVLVYPAANAPFAYWVPGADGRTLWYPSVRVVSPAGMDTWEKALERAATMLGG